MPHFVPTINPNFQARFAPRTIVVATDQKLLGKLRFVSLPRFARFSSTFSVHPVTPRSVGIETPLDAHIVEGRGIKRAGEARAPSAKGHGRGDGCRDFADSPFRRGISNVHTSDYAGRSSRGRALTHRLSERRFSSRLLSLDRTALSPRLCAELPLHSGRRVELAPAPYRGVPSVRALAENPPRSDPLIILQ